MRIHVIISVLILSSIAFPLTAQENEETVEELYLKGSVKIQIIKAEAESRDREIKLFALQEIEKMIDNGSAADEPEIIPILGKLGGQGVTYIVREQGMVINYFPEVRREAARLLGKIGGEKAARELSLILLSDPEPMVASEAIFAISNIDVENVRLRNRSMAAAIYRQSVIKKDNNFAIAFLLAIENLAKREDGINDPMIFEEITKLADQRQGYNSRVRGQAFSLLQSLQDY